MQVFLNQSWQQMRASLTLLVEKTKTLFGKDAARKKLYFCIHYLWKTKEKSVNKNKNVGVCVSMKPQTTCKNLAQLDD